MAKKKALPKDTNKKAASVVAMATGESKEETKSAAQLLGRQGGLKGGKARAKSLSAKRRSEIAKKAAAARWGSKAD